MQRMAPAVKCVYVGSRFTSGLANLVKKALEKNGDGDKIEVVELVFKNDEGKYFLADESAQKIPEMEYLYTDPDILGQIFCHPKSQIKWAQLGLAGCDKLITELKKTEKKPDFIVTRRDEGFPIMMGEYVVGHIIARERHFPTIYDLQKAADFGTAATRHYRLLNTLTVGIIGLGVIGSEVARYCKAMNMRVLGIVRDERFQAGDTDYQHVDHVSPMSQMSSVLESCDYLVSVLPNTPQTTNLFSGDVFQPCHHKKTVFINVGRGNVIDDDSLVNAVKQGWLGGAILDVFNVEPLPSSSPLWTLPGVTITPHVAAISTRELATGPFIYNLNALREGKPLKCVVDFDKGY